MIKSIKKKIPKNIDILILIIVNLIFLLYLMYDSDLKNLVLYLLVLGLLLQINIKLKYNLLLTFILTSLFYLYKKNKIEEFNDSIDIDKIGCDSNELLSQLKGYFEFIKDENNKIEGVDRNELVTFASDFLKKEIGLEELSKLSQTNKDWITNNVLDYELFKKKCKEKYVENKESKIIEYPLDILRKNSEKLDNLNDSIKNILNELNK